MSLLRSVLFYSGFLRHFADDASVSATTNSCNYVDEPPFNSTGTASFAAPAGTTNSSKPWYFSVALRENSAGNSTLNVTRTRTGYMSVPDEVARGLDSNATKLCVYLWEPQNSQASKDGSCKQVFSSKCLKYIQDFSPADDSCPALGSDHACNNFFTVGSPLDFTDNRNCSSNVDSSLAGIPDAYTTRGVFSFSDVGNHFDSAKEFKMQRRKPVPLLLLFSSRHNLDLGYSIEYHSQLLCIAPTNVSNGNEGPGSTAANITASMGALLAVVAAAILGFLF